MTTNDPLAVIQLVECLPSTEEQRADPSFVPQLKINQAATDLITREFQSPISIVALMGKMGAGKSKLASLIVASLLGETNGEDRPTFRSGDDPKGITRGVWMWPQPLKHRGMKRGSILILDCEGMGGENEKNDNNLYLFCLIVSSVLALVIQSGRIEQDQCNRLYIELKRFEKMLSPHILPSTWLVPLELPELRCNDERVDATEWISKVFTVDIASQNLANARQAELQDQYDFIRRTLPNMTVTNLPYLPNKLKDTRIPMDKIQEVLANKSLSKDYRESLEGMLRSFLKTVGKRLPGSDCIPRLAVRPAELAYFMSDLVAVINTARDPNPDQLISRCLLKRFQDGIVQETEMEFRQQLLSEARQYAKEKIEKQQTQFDLHDIDAFLNGKRASLVPRYCDQMRTLAAEKVYGTKSILLQSEAFNQSLHEAEERMNVYAEPRELFVKIRNIYGIATESDQNQAISREFDNQLSTLAVRLCREKKISQAIEQVELQGDIAACPKCNRHGGIISITHECLNERKGNYYRYDVEHMVCGECRQITLIGHQVIRCNKCDFPRTIAQLIN